MLDSIEAYKMHSLFSKRDGLLDDVIGQSFLSCTQTKH
jgi:hypothetical protein